MDPVLDPVSEDPMALSVLTRSADFSVIMLVDVRFLSDVATPKPAMGGGVDTGPRPTHRSGHASGHG